MLADAIQLTVGTVVIIVLVIILIFFIARRVP